MLRREYLDFHLDNNFINIRELWRNNNWFDTIQVHDFDDNNYLHAKEIKNLFMFFIHEGYYVLHAVNEAYLPHSSMYGCGIANNIELSHGYNDNMDVFYLLDYNKSRNFLLIRGERK